MCTASYFTLPRCKWDAIMVFKLYKSVLLLLVANIHLKAEQHALIKIRKVLLGNILIKKHNLKGLSVIVNS